ncbi:hypothetical protein [Cohnella sp. AR92]|uniref:hypothetical protein n=1 Tax=Cohnella sp. AR92 TaxID=648716 RepID=UPI000F8DEE26|nr:hypothetical protein [Cohnella sp. AR92]RUS47569.1 hypothetical protein ELR57_07175 [Cohnella sp. AR92]
MKRIPTFLLGAVVGVALTVSASTYAASAGLIGKKITSEVPIVLDGKKLSEKGSVAEGTTLLPVRSLAGAFQAGVEFKDGTVYLTTSSASTEGGASALDDEAKQGKIALLNQQIQEISERIAAAQASYDETQKTIENAKAYPELADFVEITTKNNEKTKATIDQLEAEKATIEAQLKALQQ